MALKIRVYSAVTLISLWKQNNISLLPRKELAVMESQWFINCGSHKKSILAPKTQRQEFALISHRYVTRVHLLPFLQRHKKVTGSLTDTTVTKLAPHFCFFLQLCSDNTVTLEGAHDLTHADIDVIVLKLYGSLSVLTAVTLNVPVY